MKKGGVPKIARGKRAPENARGNRFAGGPSAARFALAAALLAAALAAAGGEALDAFVTRVEDGDTLRLSVTGAAETVRCRLAGIDAPERGQAFSEVARARLAELVEKKRVSFEDLGPDKYRRRLGRLSLPGVPDVNLEMVRGGYAWHLPAFLTNGAYAAAQEEARSCRRGLWADDRPVEPRVFRKDRAPR